MLRAHVKGAAKIGGDIGIVVVGFPLSAMAECRNFPLHIGAGKPHALQRKATVQKEPRDDVGFSWRS